MLSKSTRAAISGGAKDVPQDLLTALLTAGPYNYALNLFPLSASTFERQCQWGQGSIG